MKSNCPITPVELIGADPTVAFKAGWDAAMAAVPQLAPMTDTASLRDTIAALESKLRMIVSHATMGSTDGSGMSVNDICVQITAFRNDLYREAQAAALAAAPQPDVIGRADNMPLADMARAEAFRTLARCIRDPLQPRKMGLSDLAGVLAWEERRITALAAAPHTAPDRETCDVCDGTGIAGHPDSGYICHRCEGSGAVDPQPASVDREALVELVQGAVVINRYAAGAIADDLLDRYNIIPK